MPTSGCKKRRVASGKGGGGLSAADNGAGAAAAIGAGGTVGVDPGVADGAAAIVVVGGAAASPIVGGSVGTGAGGVVATARGRRSAVSATGAASCPGATRGAATGADRGGRCAAGALPVNRANQVSGERSIRRGAKSSSCSASACDPAGVSSAADRSGTPFSGSGWRAGSSGVLARVWLASGSVAVVSARGAPSSRACRRSARAGAAENGGCGRGRRGTTISTSVLSPVVTAGVAVVALPGVTTGTTSAPAPVFAAGTAAIPASDVPRGVMPTCVMSTRSGRLSPTGGASGRLSGRCSSSRTCVSSASSDEGEVAVEGGGLTGAACCGPDPVRTTSTPNTVSSGATSSRAGGGTVRSFDGTGISMSSCPSPCSGATASKGAGDADAPGTRAVVARSSRSSGVVGIFAPATVCRPARCGRSAPRPPSRLVARARGGGVAQRERPIARTAFRRRRAPGEAPARDPHGSAGRRFQR